MQNPFESGHIKNYLLLYASVVLIMILFFIASTLFHDVDNHEKKVFNSKIKSKTPLHVETKKKELNYKFKLLDKNY